MKNKTATIAITAFILSTTAFSASFPCVKATSDIEKLICSDPLLGKMDEVLAYNYHGMLNSNFGNTPQSLKAEQRRWVASRNKCKTKQCVVSAYKKRIDETCDYGVVSGGHPDCIMSSDIK